MPRTTAVRTYGRHARRTRPLFPETVLLSNAQSQTRCESEEDSITRLAEQISSIYLDAPNTKETKPLDFRIKSPGKDSPEKGTALTTQSVKPPTSSQLSPPGPLPEVSKDEPPEEPQSYREGLRVLTWADVCPPGDRIQKIAEASYAEVYRVTNQRGTSIIKVIRLESPLKPQTKAQVKSGLVDEEPHREEDLLGELKISEWLADVPGFVVYKERYVVKGRATKGMLETHQTFHRRAKRKDPDRLQFYPSPSRYLHETEFLVIELGDAGTSLEDFELVDVGQLWDIFLLVAIALARAENEIRFEHRDLHEGNLCVRQLRPARPSQGASAGPNRFGSSGLDITILDYGLSRAEDPDQVDVDDGSSSSSIEPVAFDLEKDLTLFTSTHAPQCKVYRQMRSFLIRGDRCHLSPAHHTTPYYYSGGSGGSSGRDGEEEEEEEEARGSRNSGGGGSSRISWADHNPYTNVLWLAYIYEYLASNFCGDTGELEVFRRETAEAWAHINPEAPARVLSFGSATDVVRFAVEAGWLTEAQLISEAGSGSGGEGSSQLELDCSRTTTPAGGVAGAEGEGGFGEESSIVEVHIVERSPTELRKSPRRRRKPAQLASQQA